LSQHSHSDLMSDDPRHQLHELRVAEVIRETADAASFVFEVSPELAEVYAYKPGQFFTFEIPWQDFRIRRCYSLSSSPGWDARAKVTIKRVADGRMSNWMNDQLRQGDLIQVLPPGGAFILHETDRPLVFFGGGSGITPVISLLKQALLETSRRIKMIYANRDLESVIFKSEIDQIAADYSERFELVHHLDSDDGFLTPQDVAKHAAGWMDADFYVCGPTPFMDTIEEALPHDSLQGGNLHVERFVSAHDPDRSHEEDAVPSESAVPERIVIHLEGQRHEVEYRAGETLLSAAIRADIDAPFSCQDGYCSCCMAKLVRGEVFMPTHEALNARELDEGWILACQAKPLSAECEIEYED
jgi:3-ketosteroid 9alpha-monooxygenase subunit B